MNLKLNTMRTMQRPQCPCSCNTTATSLPSADSRPAAAVVLVPVVPKGRFVKFPVSLVGVSEN